MKVLVPTVHPVPAESKAKYIINIAKSLGAEVIALHILQKEEYRAIGEEALNVFAEAGRDANVNVIKVLLNREDIISTIIEAADKEEVSLIVMGASKGKIVSEWVSSDVMEKTKIPVVVIPHEYKAQVGN